MKSPIKIGSWVRFPDGAKDGKTTITECIGIVTDGDFKRPIKKLAQRFIISLFSDKGVFLKRVVVAEAIQIEVIETPDFAQDIVIKEVPDYEQEIAYTTAIYDKRKNLIYDHTIRRDVKKEIKALQKVIDDLQSL